jgi:hypothetical protein
MSIQDLCSFGVCAETGECAFQMTWEEAAELVRHRMFEPQALPMGVMPGVDPTDLSSAGWGVVLPENAAPGFKEGVKEALSELLCHRKAVAAQLYQELLYREGESKIEFLARHKLGPAQPVDPETLPYYLLLVGDPEQIPFSFQYQLGVQCAVGRLFFDSMDEYANYARSVVRAEKTTAPGPKKAALFGVTNPRDWITAVCVKHLVKPLRDRLTDAQPGWQLETHLGEAASKEQLYRLLGGAETPALLFTAGHGMWFDEDNPIIFENQGGLVCSDWPGRSFKGLDHHYFAARDVSDEAQLQGVICFHLACFSAGTPTLDSFGYQEGRGPLKLANRPFVARLPQRLLGHGQGGALAVIGHIDTTWAESFLWDEIGQPAVYEAALRDIMAGLPVGMAMEHFSSRYAELATTLSELQISHRKSAKQPADDKLLVKLWTAHNDARGFVVLGDPAVRLRTGDNHVK